MAAGLVEVEVEVIGDNLALGVLECGGGTPGRRGCPGRGRSAGDSGGLLSLPEFLWEFLLGPMRISFA